VRLDPQRFKMTDINFNFSPKWVDPHPDLKPTNDVVASKAVSSTAHAKAKKTKAARAVTAVASKVTSKVAKVPGTHSGISAATPSESLGCKVIDLPPPKVNHFWLFFIRSSI
jgi:hypothetical protein